MNRVVIIGQAPSRRSDPSEPLSGTSGRRLARLCDMTLDGFLTTFERRNLIESYRGPALKGDRFVGLREARQAALALRPGLAGRKTVVVGFAVAKAFRLTVPPFAFVAHWETEFAFIPHPSSINLWWNEPANEARARVFLRDLARETERSDRSSPRWLPS